MYEVPLAPFALPALQAKWYLRSVPLHAIFLASSHKPQQLNRSLGPEGQRYVVQMHAQVTAGKVCMAAILWLDISI